MAAATLAAPGSEFGPCAEPCKHRDCAATRATAESDCIRCDEPIGYDTRYYVSDRFKTHPLAPTTIVYVHASCEEAAVAAR